jgi:hypothetical protein
MKYLRLVSTIPSPPKEMERSSYRPSLPAQQTFAQHSKQPMHARAVQSCVITIAHWLFIREPIWMQHMQQQ